MIDPWRRRIERWLLRENQIRGALEAHRTALPETMRRRYDSLLRMSEKRIDALEAALRLRGESSAASWSAWVRAIGRVTGRFTAWAGTRRILSMDIDGVRGLESSYFEAYHEKPPREVACMLFDFIGGLESDRAALVEEARPLFRT